MGNQKSNTVKIISTMACLAYLDPTGLSAALVILVGTAVILKNEFD